MKKVIFNTIYLYLRLIVVTCVALYTVRLVYKNLGVVDYGLFNLVAGVVAVFTFVSGTISTATQRFLSFSIGIGESEHLKDTFSMALWSYMALSFVILIFAETIGRYVIFTNLNIPPERIKIAIFVFHFAVFSLLASVLVLPFRALIISHENMKVFAWYGIIEAFLKLILVLNLNFCETVDKLLLHSYQMFLLSWLIAVLYLGYCSRKYDCVVLRKISDLKSLRNLILFSTWNLFGAFSGLLNNQGGAIIINIYFGPVVNASRAVAAQVSGNLNNFVQNFMAATRPHITKLFAKGKISEMENMTILASKICFYSMLILAFPLYLNLDYVLRLWLGEFPSNVTMFISLLLLQLLIDSFSYPLMAVAQATGKIALYQSVVGGLMILPFPLSFYLFAKGFPEYTIYIVNILIASVCLFARLVILKAIVGFDTIKFLNQVIVKALPITLSNLLVVWLGKIIGISGFHKLMFDVGGTVVITLGLAILFALNNDEKNELGFKMMKMRM